MATEKYNKIIEEIGKLTALELSELVKALEDKFGVSAAAPMMVAPTASASSANGADSADKEEKTAFDVVLVMPIKESIWLYVKKSEKEFEKIRYPGFVFVPLIEG